jgi:hypothetical protein
MLFGAGAITASSWLYWRTHRVLSVGLVNAGTTSSANALAVETGGGIDVRISHHLAIRAIQASYMRTQFPNTATNVPMRKSMTYSLPT